MTTEGAAAPRDENLALLDLLRALRGTAPAGAGLSAVDYSRVAMRVQGGVVDREEFTLRRARTLAAPAADPAAERLAALRPAEGEPARPWRVLAWLRTSGVALDYANATTRGDTTADGRAAAKRRLLDALATASGVATAAERAAWAAAPHGTEGRRQWARLRLREAWRLWFGAPW